MEKLKDLCVERAKKNGEDPFVPVITGYHGYFRRHELWEKYLPEVTRDLKNKTESD